MPALKYKKNRFIRKNFYIPTNDGWKCNTNHYFRTGDTLLKKIPIILCHGIASNSQLFCISDGVSMVEFLTSYDYHVYSIDLRGVGRSKQEYNDEDGIDFNFDDLLMDIGPIIEYIIDYHRQFDPKTSKIHWVGHSMGALLMYAFLSKNKENKRYIRSFVSIGAPVEMKYIGQPALLDIAKLKDHLDHKKQINLKPLKKAFAFLLAWLDTKYHHILINKYAITNKTIIEFLKKGSDNIAPSLLRQFGDWILKRKMRSLDDSFNYEDMGKNINVPTLLLSGSYDTFCSPHMLLKTYFDLNLPKSKKKIVILSRVNGDSYDYCHTSIIMGKKASQEVFPHISDWIQKFS